MFRTSPDIDSAGSQRGAIPPTFVLAILIAGAVTALIGLSALFGYAFNSPVLRSGLPGYPPMKPNAAIGFILAGVGLMLRARSLGGHGATSPLLGWVERGIFIMVLLLGTVTMIEWVARTGQAFDEVFFKSSLDSSWYNSGSRMAPLTAVNFMLLGAALLYLHARSGRRSKRALYLGLPPALSSLLVFIGYAFKQNSVFDGIPFAAMALNTSLGFVAISASILLSRQEFGIVRLLSDRGMSGLVARRIVPLALLLPILLEWLRDAGEDAGIYSSDFGSVLVVCVYLVFFAITLWWLLGPVRRAEASRLEAESALRENDDRYRIFLDSISDLVYMKDSQYRHVISNKALNAFFGKEREEIIGKTDFELMTPPDASACRASDSAALGSKQIVRSEELIGDRWFETVKFPVPLPNHETGVGSIIRDVNERKLAEAELVAAKERAERSDRLKDEFIANISHEIRTPLNVILGFADIVEETFGGAASGEKPRMFASIRNGAERLTRTVDMILSFSRLKAGELTLHRETFDLSSFLEDRVKEMRQRAEKKGLKLRYENALGSASITADPYCMSQVLGNLLDNAIKYTAEGSVTVFLHKDANGEACFDVADTGIGISESYLESLFMPYTQEEQGYTRSYEGIGLGLALVKRYLDLHSMRIVVRSSKHAGTTFTIHLGTAVTGTVASDTGAREHAEAPAAPASAVLPDSELRHVLLVEDDVETVEYMVLVLQDHYEVSVADNRNDAMRILSEATVDIVLMDISLQGGTHGLDVVREIRASATLSAMPVIAVTAHAFPADESACYDAGCDAYLAKPVSRVQLFETMARALAGDSLSRLKAD